MSIEIIFVDKRSPKRLYVVCIVIVNLGIAGSVFEPAFSAVSQ